MRERGLSGLGPLPQRGSNWWPQSYQATWAQAEIRKCTEAWRLELPVPSSPLRTSRYPFLCLWERNSSGTQITATTAGTAGWKPLCERVKNLIHLKTWKMLWNNPQWHVWLTGREAGILYFILWMHRVAVHFSIKPLCQDSLAVHSQVFLVPLLSSSLTQGSDGPVSAAVCDLYKSLVALTISSV